MTMIDKIRQFPRIKWKPTIDAPKGEILLVLVRDGVDYYTELAYLNEFREWVNIPHLHQVMGWLEIPEAMKQITGARTSFLWITIFFPQIMASVR